MVKQKTHSQIKQNHLFLLLLVFVIGASLFNVFLLTNPKSSAAAKVKAASVAAGSGLSTITVNTPKGSFRATVMTIDLSRARMVTDTAQDHDCAGNCQLISLAEFVRRNNAFAGINGTYFCPGSYGECASKRDSFDFPVYNSRLNKWINGDKLGWGGRAILYADGSGAQYQQNSAGFGGGLTAGVINYPGILNGGNVQIDDNQSGLSAKQKARGTKIGIGRKSNSTIQVVVAYKVTMQEFAHVFKSLGATDALNLDSGGSLAMWYGGRYVMGPGRNLPNAILFTYR